MKIKYLTDGTVLAMGSDVGVLTQDQLVLEVDFEIPPESLSHFTFDGQNLVRKSDDAIKIIDTVFVSQLCEDAIFANFRGSDYFNNPQAWLIAKLIDRGDLADVKAWAEANLTADDLTKFKSCFVQNGVDFWPKS